MFRCRDGVGTYGSVTYPKHVPKPTLSVKGNPDPVAEAYALVSKEHIHIPATKLVETKVSDVQELDDFIGKLLGD